MHIRFAELPVADQDRAKDFYCQRLGCGVVADQPMGSDGWRWVELRLPGVQTNFHFTRRADDTPSETPCLVLVCDDIEAKVTELRTRGVAFLGEVAPAPYDPKLLVVEFHDSEGNLIVVSSK